MPPEQALELLRKVAKSQSPATKCEKLHLVPCQGRGVFAGLKPLGDALLTVHMMLTKEACQDAAPGQLSGFERWPLAEKVAK